GARHHADRRLADATPEIVARHDDRLDLGHLGEPHDLVAVEVEIDHAPVLDLALAVERGGEAIGDRAFDLGGDLVRIDRMAAIERHHHAMHLEPARRAHRHLGAPAGVAAIAHY